MRIPPETSTVTRSLLGLLGAAVLTGLMLLLWALWPSTARPSAEVAPGIAILLLIHGAAGILAALALLAMAPARWLRGGHRNPRHRAYGLSLYGCLALALLTGLWFLVRLALPAPPSSGSWALLLHLGPGIVVALLLLLRAAALFPNTPGSRASRGVAVALFASMTCAIALPHYQRSPGYRAPLLYYQNLVSSSPGLPDHPPNDALLSTAENSPVAKQSPGPGHGLILNQDTECKSCHRQVYRDWAHSAHRSAAFEDPFYRAALAALVAQQGQGSALVCARCHDPERLLAGAPVWNPPTSPDAMGVGCLSCHGGRVERGGTGDLSLSGNGLDNAGTSGLRRGMSEPVALPAWQKWAIRLFPLPHRRAMQRIAPADRVVLCASCHRMSVNLSLNHYKFILAQDEYGAWLRSPQAHREARVYYPLGATSTPTPPRDCLSCHGGAGAIHSFDDWPGPGGLKASAGSRSPTAGALAGGVISLDLFSLQVQNSRSTIDIAPLPRSNRIATPIPAGTGAVLSVVVSNRGVGHTFPAGDTDAKECWLDVQARASNGRLLWESGKVGPDGSVDPSAHFYRRLWLDRHARPVLARNLQDAVTSLYNHVIEAGASDVVRYRFSITAARFTITASLRYRSIGIETARLLGSRLIPPDRTIASATIVVQSVSPKSYAAHPVPTPGGADRWNQYGIGCLLQGDARNADRAFRTVQTLAPQATMAYINRGRLFMAQGQLVNAAREFARALKVHPGDASTRAWMGSYYLQVGQYLQALDELQSARAAFPQDPQLWFDIGRCDFQLYRYSRAADAFRRSLDLDPDQIDDHYQLMRTYQALHRMEDSQLEQAIYLYIKEDESMDHVASLYAARHPTDAREASSIHEHPVVLER